MSNLYEQTSGISNQIIEAVCNELLSMQPGSKRNSGDIANELSNRFNVDKIFIQSIIRLTISISPEHTCKQGRYGGIRRAGGLDQTQESSDALSDAPTDLISVAKPTAPHGRLRPGYVEV